MPKDLDKIATDYGKQFDNGLFADAKLEETT